MTGRDIIDNEFRIKIYEHQRFLKINIKDLQTNILIAAEIDTVSKSKNDNMVVSELKLAGLDQLVEKGV